ncbi:MAG: GNAT family N-acetyltransferase [Clostridia bacterium]|nr:GNAT family N-acetyltransferase [Clostridia bacterium]
MRELTISQDYTEEDLEVIREGLLEDTFTKLYTDQTPLEYDLNLTLKNEEGEIIGGLISSMYWYILNLSFLWVRKDYQGLGYGTKLLHKAEELAKQKGCTVIYLDTFDVQAPDFYKKHGYELFGVLENSPKGHSYNFLKKEL